MHLAIDLLGPKLEARKQRRLQRFIDLLILLFALSVLVIGGLRLLYITQVLGQLSPSLRVPMAVVYSVLPISGLLIIYYKIADIQAKEI
jgi:TRAP-type C4-dicarboxylate transport system permease small subunit